MKVGVLGTGDVGKSLGNGMLLLGHEVMMGSRDANNESAAEWAKNAGTKALHGTFGEAAKFGEIGKIVVDATNPLEGTPPTLGIVGRDSLGERVQKTLPKAKVVKAFNTVNNALFVHPKLSAKPDMFVAGNDDAARAEVAKICDAWGWGVADLGGIESARYCEALAMAWIVNGIRNGAWGVAYKMIS